MIIAIGVVSAVLCVLFIVAAVAGNRAQTRMAEAERLRQEALDSDDGEA